MSAFYGLANSLFAYEEGKLDEEQTIELFQALVDNGWAWQLQGRIGRTAMDLILAGKVKPPAHGRKTQAQHKEDGRL